MVDADSDKESRGSLHIDHRPVYKVGGTPPVAPPTRHSIGHAIHHAVSPPSLKSAAMHWSKIFLYH